MILSLRMPLETFRVRNYNAVRSLDLKSPFFLTNTLKRNNYKNISFHNNNEDICIMILRKSLVRLLKTEPFIQGVESHDVKHLFRVSVSTFYHNTCGVRGVDRAEIGSNRGVPWVLINFISVSVCSLRLRFERFFCLGVS